MDKLTIKESDFVKSLEKGLLVIRAFSQEHPTLTISEAAKITNLTRPAARRILLTLTVLGYLKQDATGTFSPTPKILSLGYAYLASNDIWSSLTPSLETLSNQVQESTSISVLEGDEIIYVARFSVKKIMSISLSVGSRLPAYATSMGQVLLAYLQEEEFEDYMQRVTFEKFTEQTIDNREDLIAKCAMIREQGYNIVREELENGLTSIAVPLFNRQNKVVAALNISLNSAKFAAAVDLHGSYILPLFNAAKRISEQLKNQII
ncbi:MAG TPA: IclR family transcriptional regulator C-terminal domain-containing protein [Ureibacillus sp.]|nr:IclR family transcriptional regulator C-terminal domain-containing protein [Ureibacillus sp.]